MSDLAQTFFTTPAMSAIFSAETHVRHMLQFEAALASAEARAGVIPQAAAEAIATHCHNAQLDIAALYREAVSAGTLAIPLVRALTAQLPDDVSGFVHWGATSQDLIDTAMMLQMRDGLDVLIGDLLEVCASCAKLADQHRQTLMAGRTLLQQATPISFGLKAARWLGLATRQVQALRDQREHSLALQFGGAAGTLAALGDHGMPVAESLAEQLDLPLPDLPWHAERDRIATIATTLGVAAGAMAKIANDIVLLAQSEVAEASEAAAAGKGGSSAMPQKRNPVDTMEALAAARLAAGSVTVILAAMANEHERAVGGWQAEWVAIPDLFRYTAGAIARVQSAVEGLQVDAAQMRINLDRSGGVIMAESITMRLAQRVGRIEAQRLIRIALESATSDNSSFQQALHDNEQICALLSHEAIDQVLDPDHYLGSAGLFIDRALRTYRTARDK